MSHESQFARGIALYAGLCTAFYVTVLVANFYFVQWLFSRLNFKSLLDGAECLMDIIVYTYGIWMAVLMLPPALAYFRKRKEPKSVLKVASLICLVTMILSDSCFVLLSLFG